MRIRQCAAGALLSMAITGCYTGLPASPEPTASGGLDDGDPDGPDTEGEQEEDDDDDGGTTGEPDAPTCGQQLGASPLLRLTRQEYRNAIGNLLGLETDAAFASDEQVGPFFVNGSSPPAEATLDDYRIEAERLAELAVADIDELVDCGAADATGCAEGFITTFGTRAFRRPLSSGEQQRYLSVYDAASDAGFAAGVQWVIAAMLQSPHFLYRIELGSPGDGDEVLLLTDHEVASRLSFALWRSIPDEALLEAAANGELLDEEGLETQIRRMLDDPQFAAAAAQFHVEWLQLGGLANLDKGSFEEFDEGLRESMRHETELFAAHVLTEDDGRLATLLSAPYTFVDAPLAALYGLPAPDDGFARVDVDGTTRGGLLSHAGLLAMHGEPGRVSEVWRGRLVRFDLLCDELPPPPAEVEADSETDRLETPACRGCHVMMDPIGAGLSDYDGLGRYRPLAAEPATGELTATDVDGTFSGPVELGAQLSESETVHACVTRQWFQFSLGRIPTEDDACILQDLTADFEASDGDVVDLIVQIAHSNAFDHRRLAPTEED